MTTYPYQLPQDIYEDSLRIIRNVDFTRREIDIIACLLSVRTAKTIAALLSIRPRTVEAHTRNITLKLERNSREGIIDFIEKSDKHPALKNYYTHLLIQNVFTKQLRYIAGQIKNKHFSCYIVYAEDNVTPSLLKQLKKHLEIMGVKDVYKHKEKSLSSGSYIFLNDPHQNAENLDFGTQENYYFTFFHLLKKLIPDVNVDQFLAEFKKHVDCLVDPRLANSNPNLPSEKEKDIHNPVTEQPLKKYTIFWRSLAVGIVVLTMSGIGFYVFRGSQKNSDILVTRSDLILPTESAFLNRPDIISQIDNSFKGQQGIQTIALVGTGGAGKTTLAHQYVHQQKANVIWEINAETQESLKETLENLAQALAKTEEDKKRLREFHEINEDLAREEKILQFVKEHLRESSKWFLIFDNVEKFTDIQKYFPCDFETWGQGKVIITTRDINIQNSKHVNHTIPIGELDHHQKLLLFSTIMNAGKEDTFSSSQKEEAVIFLEMIPPYPLDISVAAYYIKSTNTPYESYLENLSLHHKEFANVQARLLNEQGDYLKTRYSIVSLSCQKIIDTQKDFVDLLLLISILDSQNIPIEILKNYKKDYIIDDFIYNLKKYSLITNVSQTPSHLIPTISIHRSTQAIALSYLEQRLNSEEKRELVQGFVNTLVNYADRALDEQNAPIISLLFNHYERFLSHDHLLTESSRDSITRELAYLYADSNSLKTKEYLERGLESLKEGYHKGDIMVIRPLVSLGRSYRDLGHYKKAKEVLEKTHVLIKQHPDLQGELGICLVYLGTTYRDLGNYEKAKHLLGEALMILKQNLPTNNLRFAEALAYMGLAQCFSGDYVKAKPYLEQSCELYKKFFPEYKIKIGWSCSCLAGVYGDLAYVERSKDLLEQSLDILKPCNKTNPLGFTLLFLGNIHRKLGNYEKAYTLIIEGVQIFQEIQPDNQIRLADAFTFLGVLKGEMGDYRAAEDILRYCLSIYEKTYGNEHVKCGEILENLGVIYLLEGHLDKAEGLLQKSFGILQKNNHSNVYLVLENLADLYLKKSILETKNRNNQQAQGFREQAMSYLKQSLEAVKAHFPADSPHLERIQSKLQTIEKTYGPR